MVDEPKDKQGASFSSYQTDPGIADTYYHKDEATREPKGNKPKRPLPFWTRLLLFFVCLGIIVATGSYIYFSQDLPSIAKVTDYRPALTTQVLSNDLELIGEFAKQNRHLTPLDEIPPLIRQAFIASEDSRFFEHTGVDFVGILRAMVKNIQAGGIKQGGSTITQQVAKSLLLSPERTIARKIREAILAQRIERTLTKDEILYLYLNQIYLGHGAYGVQAGARIYFNKDLNQLTLAETALLAGMPTAPSRDNPFNNPARAKEKRANVLRKMEDLGFISEEDRLKAQEEPFVLNDEILNINKTRTPYFTEHVRRYLIDKYGEQMLYEGGLKVYTSLSLSMQQIAQDAVQKNLYAVDKRYGFRGPFKTLTDEELKSYEESWQARQEELKKLPTMLPPLPPPPTGDKSHLAPREEAVVTKVSKKSNLVFVKTKDSEGVIPLALMRWARKPNPDVPPDYDKLTSVAKALKKGDVVLVRYASLLDIKKESDRKGLEEYNLFALEQEPEVQGAIVAANPENGFVKAMVGGMDYAKSEFNRAVQASRQPGSAFKPIIYSAALDKGYTTATPILDAPVVYDDPTSDEVWRPKNYSGTFSGEILFREALIKSRNVVTVKILQDIGIDYIIEYARKIGIESELTRDNTLALGSSGVTPMEMTQAYLTFAANGVKRPLVFIKKIVDRDGNVLERHTLKDPVVTLKEKVEALRTELLNTNFEIINEVNEDEDSDNGAEAEAADDKKNMGEEEKAIVEITPDTRFRITRPGQVISEETAYIMTHLLSEVVRFGTGFRVRALNRPAAGKTGTTNEYIDAWFVGYTPNLVTTSWVGHDGRQSLGKLETGSRAASPMWLHFMQRALKDEPVRAFTVPGGITFARIDSKSGLLANNKTTKPILEAFKDGTQPTETEDKTKSTTTTDFFLNQ